VLKATKATQLDILAMSTSNKKTDAEIITKTKPTIFPLGFTVSQVEGSLVVVDFIDRLNGATTILESIALPKERAAQLSAALIEAIENGKSED
jgi:hypothetical protein